MSQKGNNKKVDEINGNNGKNPLQPLQINVQEWVNVVNATNNNTTQLTAIKGDIHLLYEKLKLYNEKLEFIKEQIVSLKNK